MYKTEKQIDYGVREKKVLRIPPKFLASTAEQHSPR